MPVERLTPERRRAMTREHLLAAAAEVLARRGYHGATLDEVAQTAGFTTGAIYSNFSGKEELFLALAADREKKLIEAFFAAASDPGLTATELVDSLRSVYAGSDQDDREKNWQLWTEFTLQSMRDPDARLKLIEQQRSALELVVDLVRKQFEAHGITPPLPVELIARMYIAVFTGLWQQQAIDADALDDDAFPTAVTFISRALEANTEKPGIG
ncbi:MAG TPA: TetR/AcrR family transcriptional regulator [Acidimicrobiales bacterium]|nr:TetR/AcrR family transcriptional regulator [Acidimicrobiales bacterium]